MSYSLQLAWLGIRRNPAIAGLIVLTLALGVGATMTALALFLLLSRDPLPDRSGQVYAVQIDSREAPAPTEDSTSPEPPDLIGMSDGLRLLDARRAQRQALMVNALFSIRSGQASKDGEIGLMATADLFPMFGVRFLYGGPWTAADEQARARVVVISAELNQTLFDGRNSVGETVEVNGETFRVAGISARWNPRPHFFLLSSFVYGDEGEQIFVPVQTANELGFSPVGQINCNGRSALNMQSPDPDRCRWLAYWVELESAAAVQSYRDYLLADSREQQALGRFERAPNVKLSTVNEWLEAHKVVPDDVRLGVWIAFSLFAVCLANAAGLLSAKFLRRSSEIGIRRALGATRRSVFVQYLAEAGLLGLLGSVCALPLVALGLWVIRQQPVAYAFMAEIDPWLFLELLVLAVLVTAVVGGLPAWRACRVAPAIQVKSL